MIGMTWTDAREGDARQNWQDGCLNERDAHSHDSVYVNYRCQEPGRVEHAYNPRTWERIRTLKTIWDPENRLSQNHNIPPRT